MDIILLLFTFVKVMRVKFPQILCFDEWVELYKLPDEYALGTLDKTNRPFAILSENMHLKESRYKVLEILEQNKDAVKKIEYLCSE